MRFSRVHFLHEHDVGVLRMVKMSVMDSSSQGLVDPTLSI